MSGVCKYISHALVNTALLGVLVLITAAPIGFSLVFLSSSQPTSEAAFRVTPSQIDYGEYLSFGEVAGGQVEEITVTYTAFPDFEAYYDGIFVVENARTEKQTFFIRKPENKDVRLFFGAIGATSGPTEMTLKSGEKVLVNLVAAPIVGNQSSTSTLTFTLESFSTPQ
jgi:hypothetical protein